MTKKLKPQIKKSLSLIAYGAVCASLPLMFFSQPEEHGKTITDEQAQYDESVHNLSNESQDYIQTLVVNDEFLYDIYDAEFSNLRPSETLVYKVSMDYLQDVYGTLYKMDDTAYSIADYEGVYVYDVESQEIVEQTEFSAFEETGREMLEDIRM